MKIAILQATRFTSKKGEDWVSVTYLDEAGNIEQLLTSAGDFAKSGLAGFDSNVIDTSDFQWADIEFNSRGRLVLPKTHA